MRSLKRDQATFGVQIDSAVTVLLTNEQTTRNEKLDDYLKRCYCYSEGKQ